jgi:hypothetical protein
MHQTISSDSDTITVPCAETCTLWVLFGSEIGYKGCEDGTALNNFLVKNKGRRSLESAVANIADTLVKTYSSEAGLVDTAINDGPLIKFDFILQTTRSGRIEFTVVKQPEPRPEIEAETEGVAETDDVGQPTPLPSSDAEKE